MNLASGNPLLAPWDAPHGLPPFDAVRPEHFVPAFDAALQAHQADIDAIADNPAPPSFDNTLAALDRSGRLLARIEAMFWNLASSETSPALQAVEREIAPRLASHAQAIFLNERLFRRIETLHEQRASLGLDAQAERLLERVHLDFVRAGARLAPEAKQRMAEIVEQLAALTTRFSQNVLADESGYQLVLRGQADLAGLPDFARAAARQAALERGVAEGGVVTLSRSNIVPFLTFSDRRDLRQQAWEAWVSRGEHEGPHDNRPVAREILRLRQEQARLQGYDTFADYAVADTMAGSRAAVDRLLRQVWEPAKRSAARDREWLQAVARERGEPEVIEAWDWRYYAEKVRQTRYELDEAELKPYFPLDGMVAAAFDCARRLFGLRFQLRPELKAYHPDVKVYEVHDGEPAGRDSLVGVFLHDNFSRPTKRSGAWMGTYRQQCRAAPSGERIVPIVVNNNNFAKAGPGEATLLSFDDAQTLFHEFGHALHGLLSDVRFERLAGTNVLRDFVELPSQLFEHWLSEPEVLKRHARHHQTGQPMPDALIDKLQAARRFNQAYETLRYTASALVDMAAHAEPEAIDDITRFEAEQWRQLGLPPGLGVNHRLAHFLHLFSGSSYAAGYYVYLWAEVLDADGYDAFKEAGDPFDPVVARRLREHIYSVGDSREPGEAYRAFRGRDASVEPMLRERGLLTA